MIRNGGPLDHVVINVRDRMDEAQGIFTRMGFTLTPRGYHTLGSINHLMMLGPDYLELIGVPTTAGAKVRADVAAAPFGLNGLVIRTEDSVSLHGELTALGVPVEPPIAFSRPVEINGVTRDAKFQTVRLQARPEYGGRVYFCHHYTKDLVWRPEWQHHANGAYAVERVVVAAADPEAAAAVYRTMLGDGVVSRANGVVTVRIVHARVEFLTPAAVAGRYGAAAPDGGGRDTYMASLGVRTASVRTAVDALARGSIEIAAREANRVIVPATAAMNATIEFTQ